MCLCIFKTYPCIQYFIFKISKAKFYYSLSCIDIRLGKRHNCKRNKGQKKQRYFQVVRFSRNKMKAPLI